MLNKSAIDLFALDATDGPPPTPPLVGFGPVIQFEQWVVPVPKNIVHNKVIHCDDKSQYIDERLLLGTKDVPYVYNKSTLKILVTLEDKSKQTQLINDL